MQRHVGQHRLHQRLVGEMFLEHAAMPRVMQRMRKARSHQAGGRNRAILPRQLHHLDDGADALALGADALGIGAVKLDLGRGVGSRRAVERPAQPHDQRDRGFDMQRHVRQHRLHQRLVGEMFLEHAAMPGVMQRMRQARAHQAGGGDRAILPRQLHHLDDGADALALVADALGIGAGETRLRRRHWSGCRACPSAAGTGSR